MGATRENSRDELCVKERRREVTAGKRHKPAWKDTKEERRERKRYAEGVED